MQNSTLYNKIMHLSFEILIDPDVGPVIKKAPVKPSYFLKYGNIPYNITLSVTDLSDEPKYMTSAPAGLAAEYTDDLTEMTLVSIFAGGYFSWGLVGDLSTDKWTVLE